MKARWLACALVFACAACDDEPAGTAPSATATAAPSASAPPAYPDAPYRPDDVPVAPDFEREAEKAITEKNYRDELAEILRDLGEPVPSAAASSAVPPPPVPPPPPAAPSPVPAPSPAPVP